MRRTLTCVCALLALGACRTHREAKRAEVAVATAASVTALRIDSSTVLALVELDAPVLTLCSDSVPARISARKARAAVVRASVSAEAVRRTDSVAASSEYRDTVADIKAERPALWPLAMVGLLVLILLSWIGIRSRR